MKIDIFVEDCYKTFINDLVRSMPKRGRGQYKKLAEYLSTSTVSISQIFNGERELTMEQAFLTTKFFELDHYETTYFLSMVEFAKAGHFELKNFYQKRLRDIKEEAVKNKGRVSKFKELSDNSKSIFYSDSSYSKVRLATSLPKLNTIEEIADYLELNINHVETIIDFLKRNGLCKVVNGHLEIDTQHTLLTSDSPFVKNHHVNWRINSMQKANHLNKKNEVMFTLPMSLSEKAYAEIHSHLLKFIKNTYDIVGPAEDETLAYLGLDLYKI